MCRIVAVLGRHPREQILIALVGQQVTVVEHRLAELGQVGITPAVDLDHDLTAGLNKVVLGLYEI